MAVYYRSRVAPNTEGFVWVAYHDKPPHLPVAVADTAEELGTILGVSKNTVRSCYSKYCNGQRKFARYARVYVGILDDR